MSHARQIRLTLREIWKKDTMKLKFVCCSGTGGCCSHFSHAEDLLRARCLINTPESSADCFPAIGWPDRSGQTKLCTYLCRQLSIRLPGHSADPVYHSGKHLILRLLTVLWMDKLSQQSICAKYLPYTVVCSQNFKSTHLPGKIRGLSYKVSLGEVIRLDGR